VAAGTAAAPTQHSILALPTEIAICAKRRHGEVSLRISAGGKRRFVQICVAFDSGRWVRTCGLAQIAGDPIEMVTGQVRAVDASSRTDAVRLLEQGAKSNTPCVVHAAPTTQSAFHSEIGRYYRAWTATGPEDVFDTRQGLRGRLQVRAIHDHADFENGMLTETIQVLTFAPPPRSARGPVDPMPSTEKP